MIFFFVVDEPGDPVVSLVKLGKARSVNKVNNPLAILITNHLDMASYDCLENLDTEWKFTRTKL